MEVKLDKRFPLAASVHQAWGVLSDIRATAACMPGAQIVEQLSATHYKGTVKSKVGPAQMLFAGDIEVQALDSSRRELRLLAKGADKAGSSATMLLQARLEALGDEAGCTLLGQATVTVSGKLAQFGSRLLVPVSDALLAQFAEHFRAAAMAMPPQRVAQPAVVYGADEPTTTLFVLGGQAPGAAHAQPAATPAPVKELNALALLWAAFKSWWAGLFGKKN
jgi:uncharacterized protein